MDETQTQARLQREAREHYRGTLGDRAGVNVARVEVSWYIEREDGIDEHAGYFLVHARGDEPDAETIYDTFSELVHAEMQRCQERGKFDGYAIDDTYAA